MSQAVVEVRELAKTFSLGLIRLRARMPGEPPGAAERFFGRIPGGDKLHRQVEAVKGISFEVRPNEVFGFLGPNGAGKTTTIKMLLGLIFPTRGEARIMGRPATDHAGRGRLGFLPENPYLYQYLTPLELLDLCGRLAGMSSVDRTRRAKELIERVGLGHAADRPARKFSKGMLQRLGLAQALIGDPDLLILDEPMTGLDPIGRKEVRDLMLEEKKRGRTLMFSSHILSDVEMVCDRVAIVHRGKLAAYGRLDELLRPDVMRVDIEFAGLPEDVAARLRAEGAALSPLAGNTVVTVDGQGASQQVMDAARAAGATLVSMTPRRESLEDLFVREALTTGG